MNFSSLEIGDVRMSFTGAEVTASRAERISRMTFERLASLAESNLPHLDRDVSIEHFAPPPIQVALDALSDEAIAQTGAEAIFRALLAAT
jgi:hypothetical protein